MNPLEELTEVSRKLPESAQRELLEFARSLEQRLSSARHMDYVGCLAQSPNFNEDPVKLQKALRDEWDNEVQPPRGRCGPA